MIRVQSSFFSFFTSVAAIKIIKIGHNRDYNTLTHKRVLFTHTSALYHLACESENDITEGAIVDACIAHRNFMEQGSYVSPDKSMRYNHRFYATDPGPTSVSELSAKLFQLSIPVNSGKLLKASCVPSKAMANKVNEGTRR